MIGVSLTITVFHRFLISHGASAFATGMHLVVLAWLGVTELKLNSSQFGWVQVGALLPNLIFMLWAGALADQRDPARVLAAAQLYLSLVFFGLFVAVSSAAMSFTVLMAYGVLVGIGHAFLQPARERLAADLKEQSTQKRLSLFSITQFSFQSLGVGVVAFSETLGLSTLLIFQACVSLVSAVFFFSVRTDLQGERFSLPSSLSDILEAVQYVSKHSGLKQLMGLVAFNGYMHMGVFLVLLPLFATQVYGFSAQEYALLQLVFMLGMIGAHIALHKKDTIEYPGQGALFSLVYTALVGFALAKGPTYYGFYLLIFFWGLVAGNSAGRCRLVVQVLAEPAMKGRVMAIYQIMLFGAAPIGAVVTGYVINQLAIGRIFIFMSGASVALFCLFMLSRTLWSVRQSEDG